PKPETPKSDTAPPPTAAPAPKKAIVPPAPPEPSVMDTVMDNIVPIGGAVAALLVGIGGLWALRRRKQDAEDRVLVAPTFKTEKTEPFKGIAHSDEAVATAVPEATVSNVTDVVDPIDEAQVYIDHGRDVQAEEILKEAMGNHPQREDIPLKLLEVYAARRDKDGFNAVAKDFHKLTGGVGEKWTRAAVMGYGLDPTNPLYPSTGETVDLGVPRDAAGSVDLDIGGADNDEMGTTTDILLDPNHSAEVDMEKTMVLTRDDLRAAAPAAVPDFNIELPPDIATATPAAPAVPASNMLEFNIDLPPASTPEIKPAAPAKTDDGGLDFKVDFSGINLNLDDKPAVAASAAGTKDAQWEDVQQKFDLARAYQEMGDKEGALEILHEVEREGDAEQKAEAQKMIQSLK
ncbi:MAG TPA: FimV/HubP family polar landmark protein, partial [Burkholderiales bacterium]|nr:FimV/HubP family polar landmark protein [Burkholderiales bacterium]